MNSLQGDEVVVKKFDADEFPFHEICGNFKELFSMAQWQKPAKTRFQKLVKLTVHYLFLTVLTCYDNFLVLSE